MIKVNSMISGKIEIEIRGNKSQIKKELFALLIAILKEKLISISDLRSLIKKIISIKQFR